MSGYFATRLCVVMTRQCISFIGLTAISVVICTRTKISYCKYITHYIVAKLCKITTMLLVVMSEHVSDTHTVTVRARMKPAPGMSQP